MSEFFRALRREDFIGGGAVLKVLGKDLLGDALQAGAKDAAAKAAQVGAKDIAKGVALLNIDIQM
jgi:phage gp46-like protein